MEPDLQQPYADDGLKIMLVLFEDDNGSSNAQNLRDYACEYKETYGFTFTLAIDPGAAVLGDFLEGTPMNMLLDDEMKIRYKVDGIIPDSHILEGNIEGLINE
jgi:hypothetical protein